MCIIKTDELKECCTKILAAVDNSDSTNTDAGILQLTVVENKLILAVTNGEYFVEVKKDLTGSVTDFKASIGATLFLKLMTQVTTETVEFKVSNQTLLVQANGLYKIPLVFQGESMYELARIDLEQVKANTQVSSKNLYDIMNYNTKEITKAIQTTLRPVQKMYLLDSNGCITFTARGACINAFDVPNFEGVKVLLNQKLVKLFKLFDKDELVEVEVGTKTITPEITQDRIILTGNKLRISAILGCDSDLVNTIPVEAIRAKATYSYNYEVSLSKELLIQAINRLTLLSTFGTVQAKPYCKFVFNKNGVTIYDTRQENSEVVSYSNPVYALEGEGYETILDVTNLKATIEGCAESQITVKMGTHNAILVEFANIKNVVSEVVAR
jgi:hypothetical protein